MRPCNEVTAYIPSKNPEFYSLVMLVLDYWRVYMLSHHYKISLQALQGSKILDFWRVYMLLHHYKVSLQALQGSKILDFWRVYMLSHHYKHYKVSAYLQCLSITICNWVFPHELEHVIPKW